MQGGTAWHVLVVNIDSSFQQQTQALVGTATVSWTQTVLKKDTKINKHRILQKKAFRIKLRRTSNQKCHPLRKQRRQHTMVSFLYVKNHSLYKRLLASNLGWASCQKGTYQRWRLPDWQRMHGSFVSFAEGRVGQQQAVWRGKGCFQHKDDTHIHQASGRPACTFVSFGAWDLHDTLMCDALTLQRCAEDSSLLCHTRSWRQTWNETAVRTPIWQSTKVLLAKEHYLIYTALLAKIATSLLTVISSQFLLLSVFFVCFF